MDNKVIEVTERVEQVFITDDLSLSAKGLYMSILLGYKDIDFSNKEYREAFNELWGKNYIDYKLI